MAVELTIEAGGLFKKKTDFASLSKGFSYGVTDENYCLDMDKQGEYTVLYDASEIGRGIEIHMLKEGGGVSLRLFLPSVASEITQFYHLAEHACSLLNAKQYLRDGEKVLPGDSARLIALDIEASNNALQDITSKVTGGEYQYYYIFGALLPLTLGKEDVLAMDNDLAKFAEWLNVRQQLDAYYTKPRVYQKNDMTLFGIYFLPADVRSILPTRPYLLMKDAKNIHEWYIMLGDKNRIVPFQDLIASIKGERFDADHIVVTLSQAEMEAIGKQYSVTV
jgi:hypothetical protein